MLQLVRLAVLFLEVRRMQRRLSLQNCSGWGPHVVAAVFLVHAGYSEYASPCFTLNGSASLTAAYAGRTCFEPYPLELYLEAVNPLADLLRQKVSRLSAHSKPDSPALGLTNLPSR